MQITEAKCPECGGPLQVPDGAEWLTCQFCGTSVHVSYGGAGGAGATGGNGIEPDGTIRDRGTGYGLFRARQLEGWSVAGTALQQTGTSSRPYVPQVELRDRAGGVISVRLGEAGARKSAGMKAFTGMYGSQTIGVDTANYADMPDPLMLADMTAAGIAASAGAADFRFTRQLACPDLESRKQRHFAWVQRLAKAQGGHVASPFIAVVLRTYEMTCGGQPWKMACYVEMCAAKDGMGLGDGFGSLGGLGNLGELGASVAEGLGGLASSIGGSLGGLFGGNAGGAGGAGGAQQAAGSGQTAQGNQGGGAIDFLMGGGLIGKMRRDRAAAQAQQTAQPAAQPAAQPQAQPAQFPQQHLPNQAPQYAATPTQAEAQQALSQGVAWCSPEFAQYVGGGTIYWYVQEVATFAAPAADFDAQFESAFLPFASTLETHPDVDSLSLQVVQQEAARIQGATQTQLAQNQAAFQAQQAAHRQQQAAFNSYNESISASRDARHQQFMASSQLQFNHAGPDFSEAIRGVNTYTTSDGREVELSVHADHAWENQAGDVIGTSGGVEPGAGWTEIPRT